MWKPSHFLTISPELPHDRDSSFTGRDGSAMCTVLVIDNPVVAVASSWATRLVKAFILWCCDSQSTVNSVTPLLSLVNKRKVSAILQRTLNIISLGN